MKKISITIGLAILILTITFSTFICQNGEAEWKSEKLPATTFTKDEPIEIESLPAEYIPELHLEVELIYRGSLISETIVTFRTNGPLTQKDIDPLKFGMLELKPLSSFVFETGETIIDNGTGSVFKRTSGKKLQIVSGNAFLLHTK